MAEQNPPNTAVIRITLTMLDYKLRQALLQGPPYADLTSFYDTKRSKKWTDITHCKDAEIVKACHVSLVCALIKEIQDYYKADAQGKPAAWAALLNKATQKCYILSTPTTNAPAAGPHAPAPTLTPAPTPATNHPPAPTRNPSQPVAPAPALPTPCLVPYVLVPHLAMSSTPRVALGPLIPRPLALKSSHGNNAPPAKTSRPLAPALSKPPQQRPKQKVISPAYVADLDDDDEGDDEDNKLVEAVPPWTIIPQDPQPVPCWLSGPAPQSSGECSRPVPCHLAPRNATPGPSDDPLLHAALSPSQRLVPSPSPPPYGGVQPNQGWYQQMVDYVAEVNAQNWDEQG
ncbi:hypothetical protein DXG01_017253 [Tephrocybe rancida]|nr:hypothetical protein DXG01_017253 [Tephrocybe rancida]